MLHVLTLELAGVLVSNSLAEPCAVARDTDLGRQAHGQAESLPALAERLVAGDQRRACGLDILLRAHHVDDRRRPRNLLALRQVEPL